MGGVIAPTPHTVVVDLPAAVNLQVAIQTGATAAASDAQAAAGAMVAKAAAGSDAKAAAADARGDTASGQKAEPTAQKGPSAGKRLRLQVRWQQLLFRRRSRLLQALPKQASWMSLAQTLQHIEARSWNNSQASTSKHCRKQPLDFHPWHLSTRPTLLGWCVL